MSALQGNVLYLEYEISREHILFFVQIIFLRKAMGKLDLNNPVVEDV